MNDTLHVAVIMDGNGRWAVRRGLPRSAGHMAGVRAVRSIVEAAVRFDVDTLTLYAFSSDNWGRPAPEVDALMRLLQDQLLREIPRCRRNGIRVSVIGRRDRLPEHLVKAVSKAEEDTARGSRLHLRLAVDYSARSAILDAARKLSADVVGLAGFSALLNETVHSSPVAPDVDLLIRTGGERRLSDFLLWECAYAELVFSDTLWPDFDEEMLKHALVEYRGRERRFGKLLHTAP